MSKYTIATVKVGSKSKYFLNIRSRPTQTFTNKKTLAKAVKSLHA